jgi:hypothetical protein
MKQTMTLNQFNDKVKVMKHQPVEVGYLFKYSLKAITKLCSAWKHTTIKFSPEGDGNIWSHVEFDTVKFKRMAEIAKEGMFESAVKANLIYPDGTFNEVFIKEETDGRIDE